MLKEGTSEVISEILVIFMSIKFKCPVFGKNINAILHLFHKPSEVIVFWGDKQIVCERMLAENW